MTEEPALTLGADVDTPERLQIALAAASERKAENLKVLAVAELCGFTDYLVLCDGTNSRQVQAIADSVRQVLKPRKVRPIHVEGYRHARWILLDFGDFIVHVFDGDARDYYRLERLWADAPDVTADFRA